MTAKVEIINNNGVVEVDIEGQVSESVDISTQEIEVLETNVGGLSTIAGASDTNFTSLLNNDLVVWDLASSKFINLAFSSFESAIDHLNILNVGIASHDDIDLHIGDISNPHSVTAAQVAALALNGSGTMTGAIASSVGTFTSSVADGASAVAYRLNSLNALTTAGSKLISLENNSVEKFSIDKDAVATFHTLGADANISVDDGGALKGFNFSNVSLPTYYFNLNPAFGIFDSNSIVGYLDFKNNGSTVFQATPTSLRSGVGSKDLGDSVFLWGSIYLSNDIIWSQSNKEPIFRNAIDDSFAAKTAFTFNCSRSGGLTDVNSRIASFKNDGIERIGFDKDGKVYFTDNPLLATPVAGSLEFFEGHLFITNGARSGLVSSNGIQMSNVTVVNTIAETVIYSQSIPANTFYAGMKVLFNGLGVLSASSASETLTVKFKLGGVPIHTIVVSPTNGIDIAWKMIHEGTIRTDGSSGTYLDFSEFSESGVASIFDGSLAAHPIDTTQAGTYEVTVAWGAAKAGNSVTSIQGDLTYKH